MATRRSRKQVTDFTHAKVTGDIPVFIVKDPEGITFEIDLTIPKLTPRIPFCRSGAAIQSLVDDAKAFIDSYLTLTWQKHVFIAATPIANASGIGLEIATGVIESTSWPVKTGDAAVTIWRDAATPWETRDTPMPADFKHANVQHFPWTAELEDNAQRLRAKVASFAQTIIAGLANADTAKNMVAKP